MRRQEVTRAFLRHSQPVPEGNSTLIYVTKQGRTFVADRALTASEIWFDTPQVLYMVDTGVHPATYGTELPSREEAFSFQARVNVSWQIRDPEAAMEAGLTSAEPVFRPVLESRLRHLSRRFGVEDCAEAEEALNREHTASSVLSQGLTLLSCTVTLTLDEATESHVAERILAMRRRENREREHDEALEEARRTAIEKEAQHKLDRLAAAHSREMDERDQKHRIELQRARLDVYEDMLRDGQFGLIKLRLDRHPDDVDTVLNTIMQQHQLGYEAAREFLKVALDGGVVPPGQMGDFVKRLTETVSRELPLRTGWPAPSGISAAASPPGEETERDRDGADDPGTARRVTDEDAGTDTDDSRPDDKGDDALPD